MNTSQENNIDEIALNIWRGDTYQYIQEYLKHKEPKIIRYGGTNYETPKIILILRNQMKPMKKNRQGNYIFYRGDRNSFLTESSYNKRTFISITTDKEQAQCYTDINHILFTIEVDDEVMCLKTGIENEYLIDVDCCWKYNGNMNVLITKEDNNYQYYNELIELIELIDDTIQEMNKMTDVAIHSILPTTAEKLTADNIADYVDEFNLDGKGKNNYNYDNFIEELHQLPGIEYENGTEQMLWEKYQEFI
jgi:hypothetical protein